MSESDWELQRKIQALHEAAGSPSTLPRYPRPIQLKTGMEVGSKILKFLYKSKKEPFIFSPSVIFSSLFYLKSYLDEPASEKIDEIIGDTDAYDRKNLTNLVSSICIFYDKELTLQEGSINEHFKEINFNDESNAVKEINSAIADETETLISALINNADSLKHTSLCLGIASTFKDRFYEPFDGQKTATFFSDPPRVIDMVYVDEGIGWLYGEGEKWTALGVPYHNNNRWLWILMPNEGNSLDEVVQEFDYSIIDECFHGWVCTGNFTIPVFEIETQLTLNDSLKQIGLTELFDKNSLKFTKDHRLDSVFHAAKLKIDQYGTNAKPFRHSGDICLVDYPRKDFVADRPFIFFIADREDCKYHSIQFVGVFT